MFLGRAILRILKNDVYLSHSRSKKQGAEIRAVEELDKLSFMTPAG